MNDIFYLYCTIFVTYTVYLYITISKLPNKDLIEWILYSSSAVNVTFGSKVTEKEKRGSIKGSMIQRLSQSKLKHVHTATKQGKEGKQSSKRSNG